MTTTETNKDNCMVKEGSYDIASFIPSSSKGLERVVAREGVMSIVNAKTGKRVVLSKDLLDKIQVNEKVQFSFNDGVLAIGNNLPNNDNFFSVKPGKSKGNIYSAGLVEEITEQYSLDFSNRTSMTFDDVEYIEDTDLRVAIVKVN